MLIEIAEEAAIVPDEVQTDEPDVEFEGEDKSKMNILLYAIRNKETICFFVIKLFRRYHKV